MLLLVALDMMRAMRLTQEGPDEVAEGTAKQDIAVTPLAIPMLAGPAAMSTVTMLIHQSRSWPQAVVVMGVIVLTGLLSYVTLLLAEPLCRWLGNTGIHVVSRIMGLVLLAIAVQFILDGLRQAGVPAPSGNGSPAEASTTWRCGRVEVTIRESNTPAEPFLVAVGNVCWIGSPSEGKPDRSLPRGLPLRCLIREGDAPAEPFTGVSWGFAPRRETRPVAREARG